VAAIDIAMMCPSGSGERATAPWTGLFSSAGLGLVKQQACKASVCGNSARHGCRSKVNEQALHVVWLPTARRKIARIHAFEIPLRILQRRSLALA